jgi:peroxin-1
LFLDMFGSAQRSASPNARGIIILATAASQAALHQSLSAAHIFMDTVQLQSPNKDSRKDVRVRSLLYFWIAS